MKKRNLLLLPLFALLIAGCKPTPSSSEEPSTTSAPPSTSVPVTTSEPPVTTSEPVVTSEEPSVTSEDEESLPSVPVSEEPAATVATIAELRAMTDGKTATPAQKEVKYQVTGTVTSIERSANISNVGPGWNFTIQSGADAIMLYAIPEADFTTNWDDVKVGDLLTATGHLAPYNGLHEMGRVEYVSHVAGTPIVPEVLTDISQEALVGKDSKLVTIEGLKLHGKASLYAYMGTRPEISVNLDLRKDDVKIGTYMHYNIPLDQAQAAVAVLETITSNSTVKWTGVLGVNNNVFQMSNARASEWEIVVGDPVVLSGLAFADTTKEIAHDETYSPKLVVTPFDASVTGLVWASSNVAVATVDEAGKVTPVGPGTTDITATLNAFEAKVVVTVKAAPTGDPTEFVVKPVRGTLEVDKNAKLTTPELIATHISGLPVGTTVSATEVFVGVGGGSSSTDSMPDSYTVIKFGTSKLGGSLTVTLPAEDLIESVTIKGRSWNTDESSLTVNGVSKDFTNATPTNKEDIRTFEYELPTATNVLEFVSVKRVILTEITLKLQVEAPVEPSMDLFISEWIEPASGNNKFIEIYNPLAEAVDLSTYTMKAFPNGAATASATLALTGTLAAGETIVIYNVQQVIITTEIPSTWISQSYPGLTDFNGDDTFGLFNNDVLIDLVGEIGVDPGTEWSGLDFLGASVQTKDSNWTRHGSITVPNATFTMAEWVVGPWDTHTLGSHTVVTA